MKTFGIFIALFLMISACEQDTLPPKPCPPHMTCLPDTKPSSSSQFLQMNARLTPHVEVRNEGNLYLEWNGRATTNLLGDVNVFISQQVLDHQENTSFDIRDGYFYVWVDDHSSSLSGNYIGQGTQFNGQMTMDGIIDIQYGNGKLVAESGKITLSIATVQPLALDQSPSDIWISGHIISPLKEETDKR